MYEFEVEKQLYFIQDARFPLSTILLNPGFLPPYLQTDVLSPLPGRRGLGRGPRNAGNESG